MEKRLSVYETHIELSPYRLGQYYELEKMCSTKFDPATHQRYPVGYHYEEETQTLFLPRGLNIESLYQLTSIVPRYEQPSREARMKYKYKVKDRPRNLAQVKAISFLISIGSFSQYSKYSQLCLNAEAGFGKTYCGIVALLERGMRTIIICHTKKIYNQWLASLHEKTNVRDDRILELSGTENIHALLKKKVDTDIIVVLHSSLEHYIRKYGYYGMQEVFNHLECGTKIIDEVHLFFKNTLKIDFCANITKNFYFTATFSRSNYLEIELFKTAFSNAIRYGAELGQTKNIVYKFVYYNSRPNAIEESRIKTAYGVNSYRFIDYAINRDPEKTILEVLLFTLEDAFTHEGRTIIITSKIGTCELMSEVIKREFPEKDVGTIHSKHTEEENLSVSEHCDVIVSTLGSLGTGADIDRIRNIIVAGELFSSEITCHQLPKRCRPWENGEDSYCYELIDAGFEPILNMVKKKTKYLKEVARKIEKSEY